jgi:hypothetical protein
MAEAGTEHQAAIETKDTTARNLIGIIGVYVVLAVFLFLFFGSLVPEY